MRTLFSDSYVKPEMQFFYSRDCSHSLSMLEILTKFQTNFSPTDIEMIDVKSPNLSLPPEIVGTPTIFTDGQYFHGDDAFTRISSTEIESKARPSINSASARKYDPLDPANFEVPEQPNKRPNSQQTAQNPQTQQPQRQQQDAVSSAMNSMFEEEYIAPRKA